MLPIVRSPSSRSNGLSPRHTDTYHGRFVKLIPDELVVQAMEFESGDPAMLGEMIVTFRLVPAGKGTDLFALHENLPPGVGAADNEIGWRMALDKLAQLVEPGEAAGA